MAMWNDYEKIARRLDRIANAFERIANALEMANIIEADRKTEPTISKMEQVEDEPQTIVIPKDNGRKQALEMVDLYHKLKDEPQIVGNHADITIIDEFSPFDLSIGEWVKEPKDEPQTDCSWK